jgi:tubulin-like protein CetZ
MRIIAIGLGGAGCRITDSLYATDRRSSKVACVQALAIDVDEKTLEQLGTLPESAKMCFSALEPGVSDSPGEQSPTATIDIGEIVSRVQNFESGETDAIFFCCGLGGGMVDVAPHIIAGLRSSIVEPIFGLVTLPCLAEGERISGKAADDIEMLSTLLDGIILFDNETWHKKIRSEKARLQQKEKGFAEKFGLKKPEKILSPAQAIYTRLNEAIVRRISLILRAGEFKADGGIDLAEVVLDSGEVLNTMKGMGFITIGYAVERLPHEPLSFLSRWKPAGLFDDDQKKKASRIVELAKQAIYHEISTPCDLTSAHKALILVAGPSHELSMKGFMTVRKWIDRSIAGLETRSGDYPVKNTKNVAIIIMLSGLENIPRITELKEIRWQQRPRDLVCSAELNLMERGKGGSDSSPELISVSDKDEMIFMPDRISQSQASRRPTPPVHGSHQKMVNAKERAHIPDIFEPDVSAFQGEPDVSAAARQPLEKVPTTVMETSTPEMPSLPETEENSILVADNTQMAKRRVLVTHEQRPLHSSVSRKPSVTGSIPVGKMKTELIEHVDDLSNFRQPADSSVRTRDTERQRIERELHRQRIIAISGPESKKGMHLPKKSSTDSVEPQKRTNAIKSTSEQFAHRHTFEPAHESVEKKTVIRSKRSLIVSTQETPGADGDSLAEKKVPGKENVPPAFSDRNIHGSDNEVNIGIRDQVFRAKDAVFEGKGVRRSPLPSVRDSTLLHTDLKPKKKSKESPVGGGDIIKEDSGPESQPPKKRDKPGGKDKEISWI